MASGIECLAGIDHLLHQTPLKRLPGADALVGQDHGLLGAGGSDQMKHARDALPAHVHAEPDLGHPQMRVISHHAKIQRDRERHAAADTKALDRADGDLLHLLPGVAEPWPEFQMPAQRSDIHGLARFAFRILQVESGAERLGAAGQHHDRSVAIVLKTAGGGGELA